MLRQGQKLFPLLPGPESHLPTCACIADLPACVAPRLISGKCDGHTVAVRLNPVGQCLPTKRAIFPLVCLDLNKETLKPQDLLERS